MTLQTNLPLQSSLSEGDLVRGMIYIIDNGGQYVHRIWRSFRELGITSKIIPNNSVPSDLERYQIVGFVLSGGPYIEKSGNSELFLEYAINNEIPILGICLGHQIIGRYFGAEVSRGTKAEYGITEIKILENDFLFKGIPPTIKVWASHMDEVKNVPEKFVLTATSEICLVESMRHKTLPVFGVQFHPEVTHTERGKDILKNFYEISLRYLE